MSHRIIGWAVGLGVLIVGADASAAPVWVEAPTYAEAAKLFPARAKAAQVGGSVRLTCTVIVSGYLRNCAVMGESPGGYGFGNAARKLAERMKSDRASSARDAELQVIVNFPSGMARSAPYVASNAVWLDLPSTADFVASFPKAENGVNTVRVAMICNVAARGALTGCAVESEQPAGQGYGPSALGLTPKIRVGLLAADGTPLVGAKVRVPLRYELTPVRP